MGGLNYGGIFVAFGWKLLTLVWNLDANVGRAECEGYSATRCL